MKFKFKKYQKLMMTKSKGLFHRLQNLKLINLLTILSLLSVAAGVTFLLKKPTKDIAAAWYNDNWLYRKAIEVTNSGSDLTDFQVAITLDTASLISAGKMQSDCDDIRITDINGKLLPYWIEENNPGCNASNTKIWVKVPSIPTSGATAYVYYGNPSVENVENGAMMIPLLPDLMVPVI